MVETILGILFMAVAWYLIYGVAVAVAIAVAERGCVDESTDWLRTIKVFFMIIPIWLWLVNQKFRE